MKNILIVVLLLSTVTILSAQLVSTKNLRVSSWDIGEVLVVENEDTKIEITAKAIKLKKQKKKIKPLAINGKNYQLLSRQGAINIVDKSGEVVLMSSRDGREVVIDQHTRFTKKEKQFCRDISYYDQEGELVLRGKYEKRKIVIDVVQPDVKKKDLLTAVCMEELLQDIRREYYGNAFLAFTPLFTL